ncbi:MAG: tRNA 2-thiouridine(34) synthase MnmA [bacterium]
MKIAVLVSGGVDSSVALKLLKDQGYDVEAFYIKIWLEDELAFLGACPWEEDVRYVEQVCDQLEVSLNIISLQQEYWDRVVSYVVAEEKVGRTSSPDVLCNQQIKFGVFFDAIGQEFEKIASGHYAQIEERDGRFLLKRAVDPIKDQTYFLSRLTQKQMSRIMFPIGHLLKSQVREIAKESNLLTSERKDSQGVCFLGKIKFHDFLKHHLGTQFGDLVEYETGKRVGEHEGFWFYTVGQRKGIKLSGGPWYVVKKDVKNNIVFVSNNYFSEDKPRDTFCVSNFNWIDGDVPEKSNLSVKIRHRQVTHSCTLSFDRQDSGMVTMSVCDQGIAPGQFAVFYDDQICLGSGVIE